MGRPSYLKAMAERLAELLGVSVDRIGIYASESVFPWGLTDAKTWVAQYADMNPTGYQDAPWHEGAYDCAIRQYSSCGRLDGWAGNLDINKCYISRAEWEAMVGGSNGDPDRYRRHRRDACSRPRGEGARWRARRRRRPQARAGRPLPGGAVAREPHSHGIRRGSGR